MNGTEYNLIRFFRCIFCVLHRNLRTLSVTISIVFLFHILRCKTLGEGVDIQSAFLPDVPVNSAR